MIKGKDINILLLLNLLGVAIVASFISNSQMNTCYLKLGLNIGLFWAFKRYFNAQGIPIKKVFILVLSPKSILFLISFIGLPVLSYWYTTNQAYGGIKLLNLMAGSFPLLIYFMGLIPFYNERIVYWFSRSVLFWSYCLVFMLLLFHPININGVYHFSPLHWSHVMIGRILFCLYLITLGLLIQPHNNGKFIILIALFLISYGIIISGLRTAMLGWCLFTPLLLGWAYFTRKKSWMAVVVVCLWLLGAVSLAAVSNHNTEVSKRIKVVKNLQWDHLQKEGSYKGRYESLQICMERFKKAPILGVGLGGYYYPWRNYKAWVLKYPHNIILEYGVEMGILGLLWFFTMLWCIAVSTWKINPLLCLFFAGVFWLTLFSKNIPANILLFFGAGYYCIKPGSYYFTEA